MREPMYMTEVTVVYTCPYVPAEWIAAHGLRPRRLIPLPVEGESVVVRAEGLCPYARAFANDAVADNADGIIVTTLCDQMRRVYDLLVRGTDTPVFLLNMPKTWQTVGAQRLYVDEVKRLGRFLVRLGGRAPSHEELVHVMIDYDTDEDRVPCTSRKSPGTPIAVIGGPLMQRDRILFGLIEDCGGRIVLDATETGWRGERRPFDRRRLIEDPLLELADAYFSIPDASRRPNSELYEWLKVELTRTGARGIVFHHYVWCDAWRSELVRLREWVGLPVLGLDGEGYSETNPARLQSRILAFLEMLQ